MGYQGDGVQEVGVRLPKATCGSSSALPGVLGHQKRHRKSPPFLPMVNKVIRIHSKAENLAPVGIDWVWPTFRSQERKKKSRRKRKRKREVNFHPSLGPKPQSPNVLGRKRPFTHPAPTATRTLTHGPLSSPLPLFTKSGLARGCCWIPRD